MAESTELTSNQDSRVPPPDEYSCFSDSEAEERPQRPYSRYTPDLFSGVYRGIKRLPSVKLSRTASLLGGSKSSSSSPNTAPTRTASRLLESTAIQHVRNLNLQYSLAKPLPQTPPSQSNPPPFPARTKDLPILVEDDTDTDISDIDLANPSKMESRTSTMDSSSSIPPTGHPYGAAHDPNTHDMNSSVSSLASQGADENLRARSTGSASAGPSPAVSQGRAVGGTQPGQSAHLSGLMCNVHRTTGREPRALVGATATILGDKLYVFGGRILSRSRPAPLTSDLYELDLIRRHWTKLETSGDVPLLDTSTPCVPSETRRWFATAVCHLPLTSLPEPTRRSLKLPSCPIFIFSMSRRKHGPLFPPRKPLKADMPIAPAFFPHLPPFPPTARRSLPFNTTHRPETLTRAALESTLMAQAVPRW